MRSIGKLGVGFIGLRRTAIAIAAVLSLGLLLACGSDEAPPAGDAGAGDANAAATPPAPPAPGQPAAPSKATPSGVKVSTGELPEGYPEDLPQPPNATPQTSMMAPGQGGLITFLSTDSTQVVSDYFKTSLPEQGWEVASASDDAARSVIKATKDSRAVDVTISSSAKGDGTAVVVLVKAK